MNHSSQIRRVVLIIILIFSIKLTFGLSDKSKISILTYEPGNELYTIFGHTSLRIQDSSLHIDNIYNFGTFDFSSPFFYIRFFGGKLDYFLTIIDYKTFIHYSILEQRTIYEQTLDLTITERNNTYYRLNQIYNSSERFYKYDFFYDNCATRIRDLIQDVNSDSLQPDTINYCCKTFRELLIPYISKNYWIDFGINIVLGKEADNIAKSNDFMFLPDYVYKIFSVSKKIRKTETLIDLSNKKEKINVFSIPLLITILALILVLHIFKKTRLITFYSYNSLLALIGIFILILSILSDNSAFRNNFNIVWTLPSIIIVLTKQNIRKTFELVYLIGLIVILILRQKLYSGFSWTFIPWISILIIMYFIDLQIITRVKTFANKWS